MWEPNTAGAKNGQAKLNDEIVAEIRRTKDTLDDLHWARVAGVSEMNIKKIRQRKSWRHVK